MLHMESVPCASTTTAAEAAIILHEAQSPLDGFKMLCRHLHLYITVIS